MGWKERLRDCLAALAWLALIPALMLTGFLLVAQNGGLYIRIQDKYVDEMVTGIGDADRHMLDQALAAFLRGERDDLELTVTVWGDVEPAFSESECAHMDDVRDLFELARRARWYLALTGALLMGLWLLTGRRRLRPVRRGYFIALALWGGALLALTAWAASDFNQAFLIFHRAVFSNELWLMNPATDLMIRMLPEAFFQEIALVALAAMAVAVALPALALLPWRRWLRALRRRNDELERQEAMQED